MNTRKGRKDTYCASTRQQWADAEVTENSNRGDVSYRSRSYVFLVLWYRRVEDEETVEERTRDDERREKKEISEWRSPSVLVFDRSWLVKLRVGGS
jgi:hypothetical protein